MPYIFVVRGGANRSARAVVEERFGQGLWPMNERTPHQADLRAGDRLLIYVAGSSDLDGHCFIATGTAGGERFASARESGRDVPSWLRSLSKPLYDVPVRELRWLPAPVSARSLRHELKFIRRPQHWGNYFQGGVVRIDQTDFQRVLRVAGDEP